MKKRFSVALLFLFCCAQERSSAPSHYDKDGVRFTVPATCAVASDKYLNPQHSARAIQIECADHALFSIISIPASSAETLELFASHVAERRASNIQQRFTVSQVNVGHETPTTSDSAGASIQGAVARGIRQHFSIELLGQNTPHVAEFYMLERPRSKYFLMTQVAEKYLDDARPRWKTIFDTVEVD